MSMTTPFSPMAQAAARMGMPPNKRPLMQPHMAAPGRFPPTPQGSVFRAPSWEGPGSRGASPTPGFPMPIAMYHHPHAQMVSQSPPMSHRSAHSPALPTMQRVESARSHHGVPGADGFGRVASRSPPSHRASRSGLQMQPGPQQPGPQPPRYEPIAMPGPPMAPAMIAFPQPVPSGMGMPGQAIQAVPGALNTIAVAAPPWAHVVQPPQTARTEDPAERQRELEQRQPLAQGTQNVPGALSALSAATPPVASTAQLPTVRPEDAAAERQREAEQRQLLQEVLNEVRTMSIRQAESHATVPDLEQARQHIREEEERKAAELQEALNAQLAAKEKKYREVENRLYETLEELKNKTNELAKAKEDYGSAIATKERLEAEQQRRDIQGDLCAERLSQRCEDLERLKQELQERNRDLNTRRSTLEAQAEEREREHASRLTAATEAARRLEGDKRLLEEELEKAREQLAKVGELVDSQRGVEQETRELRVRVALLEDQLREAQEKAQRAEAERARAEQEQQRLEQDLRQWYQKFLDADKENKAYQKQYVEQRREIWELEHQLRQERQIANICTPGDYLRLAKVHEEDSLAVENGRLKKALAKSQTDLELCLRKLSEQEKEIKDLQTGRR